MGMTTVASASEIALTVWVLNAGPETNTKETPLGFVVSDDAA